MRFFVYLPERFGSMPNAVRKEGGPSLRPFRYGRNSSKGHSRSCRRMASSENQGMVRPRGMNLGGSEPGEGNASVWACIPSGKHSTSICGR